MKSAKLFLPGQFEDAFVYRGHLVVLTREHTIRSFNLNEIVNLLQRRYKMAYAVPTYLFLRNDWLVSGKFVTLLRDPEIKRLFADSTDRLGKPFVDLGGATLSENEQSLDIPTQVLLDLNVYNGRIYCGTSSGLYDIDYNWNRHDLVRLNSPRRRTDAACLSTSVKFGTVLASCGSDGLFSAIDDFVDSDHGSARSMEQISGDSLRSNWLQRHFVNYRTATDAQLFQTRSETVSSERAWERIVLTDIDKHPRSLSYILDEMKQSRSIEDDDIQFIYNANKTIFVNTYSGQLVTISLGGQDDQLPIADAIRVHDQSGGRILSVHPTRAGIVAETDNRILLFAHGKWIELFNDEVISVRSFRASRYSQNLVALTTREGIILIGLYDDET